MVKMKGKDNLHGITTFLFIAMLLGIATSTYLTYLHYAPTGSGFCDISEGLNCDIVNKSIYSEIFGIPIAVTGGLTFILVALLTLVVKKGKAISFGKKRISQKAIAKLILTILIFSALFALYLVYIEAFLLYTFCVLCLFIDLIILVSLIATIIMLRRIK